MHTTQLRMTFGNEKLILPSLRLLAANYNITQLVWDFFFLTFLSFS